MNAMTRRMYNKLLNVRVFKHSFICARGHILRGNKPCKKCKKISQSN